MAKGPKGSPGNRSGNPSAGARSGAGARSASLGQRSRGARSNMDTAGTITGGGGAGGPKKKSPSVMRESTWNNMSKGMRMKEYGTTSYAKYKAGKKASNIRGTSRTNRQMRGTGGNRS